MPEACVVDTDVISYIVRGDSRAAAYQLTLADKQLVISFMTLAELERWAIERAWGTAQVARLGRYLHRYTLVMPDRGLCRAWAMVAAGARRLGRPIQTADAWIAATALRLDVPLVTHNRDDYAGVPELQVISV